MPKSYSYIQVVLALRDEYLKNELELEKLKQYTELNDDMIEDYCFRSLYSCINNELILNRDIIKSRLKRLIESINKRVDLTTTDIIEKNSDGNYIIKEGKYKTPTIIDQKSFNEQADKILNSAFVRNSTNLYVPISNGTVAFTCSGIYINKDHYKGHCRYYSKADDLFIKASDKITDDVIFDLLNSQVYEYLLNDWQQKILEKNSSQVKEIIYPELQSNCRKLNLSIEKEKNKVLLKQI